LTASALSNDPGSPSKLARSTVRSTARPLATWCSFRARVRSIDCGDVPADEPVAHESDRNTGAAAELENLILRLHVE